MTENDLPATGLGRRSLLGAALGVGALALASCTTEPQLPVASSSGPAPGPSASSTPQPLGRQAAIDRFASRPAGDFGLEVTGVQLGLPDGARGAALTFDACGGGKGNGYDGELLDTLRRHRAPATLFLNQRWARANPTLVTELAADPLFEIANHGSTHQPLASRGQSAYGIPGTGSIAEAYDEVMENQRYLAGEFGIQARFFRCGTAHMDELCAQLTRALGLVPMNFTVNLDAGATFPAGTVATQVRSMGAGDVGIGHFNQPDGHTGEGMAAGLPRLLESLQEQELALLRLSDVRKA
ncbi:polysaccharide deacetylase family protein [Glutamicibacter sp. MNS18]|uniref:polysaccharide deacetylase family protein n=1 Tax=Glutamicibacter sp. MNS18 TaxID=2989817 RepID=UPI00223608C0|nr:polysaccharide deacetylase family protein [Glutamicibacter sp. MNS18]MCW4464544.1 polysaccharide deacetylase family protein [Glutamicibacter sp. MNS18]